MNSLQVEYFLALSKYKNFSKAAQHLYVAQPAVSKQIAALENELNMQLFSRGKGSMDLTEEGIIILKAFEEMCITFENAKKQALQVKEVPPDKFHIAFLEGLDIGAMAVPSISLLKSQYPDTNITFDCLSLEELNRRLFKNELDLIITLEHEVNNDASLDFINLYNTKPVIAVRAGHPLAKKRKLDLNILHQQTFFVANIASRGFKQYCKHLTDSLGISLDKLTTVPDNETLILNVESGLGVALLGETSRLLSNKSIKLFPIDSMPSTGIVAAWKHHNNCNHARDLFINLLIENL